MYVCVYVCMYEVDLEVCVGCCWEGDKITRVVG